MVALQALRMAGVRCVMPQEAAGTCERAAVAAGGSATSSSASLVCAAHCTLGGSGVDRSAAKRQESLRIAYADPPYPGCADLYRDHPDFDGEVDHGLLLQTLEYDYDGFCLHTSSTALHDVLRLADDVLSRPQDVRVMAWVKPFAAFKRNVSVAYAWEPVLVKAARKPTVRKGMGFTYRDWLAESITLQKGLTGAKPEKVCHWLFEVMGCEPHDDLYDLYPGTGAVSAAWETWRTQLRLAV